MVVMNGCNEAATLLNLTVAAWLRDMNTFEKLSARKSKISETIFLETISVALLLQSLVICAWGYICYTNGSRARLLAGDVGNHHALRGVRIHPQRVLRGGMVDVLDPRMQCGCLRASNGLRWGECDGSHPKGLIKPDHYFF